MTPPLPQPTWPATLPGAATSTPHTPRECRPTRPRPDPPPPLYSPEAAPAPHRAGPAGRCAPGSGPAAASTSAAARTRQQTGLGAGTRDRLARDLDRAGGGMASGGPGTSSRDLQSRPPRLHRIAKLASPATTPSAPERHLALPPPPSHPGSAPGAPAPRLSPRPPRSQLSLPGRPRRQWLSRLQTGHLPPPAPGRRVPRPPRVTEVWAEAGEVTGGRAELRNLPGPGSRQGQV